MSRGRFPPPSFFFFFPRRLERQPDMLLQSKSVSVWFTADWSHHNSTIGNLRVIASNRNTNLPRIAIIAATAKSQEQQFYSIRKEPKCRKGTRKAASIHCFRIVSERTIFQAGDSIRSQLKCKRLGLNGLNRRNSG